jgi:hypothetical protein
MSPGSKATRGGWKQRSVRCTRRGSEGSVLLPTQLSALEEMTLPGSWQNKEEP